MVVPASAACCGSLNLHMGNRKQAREFAKANVRAWIAEIDGEGLDAILVNASGCGTTVKDYAHLLRTATTPSRPRAYPRWRSTSPNG